MVSRGDRLSRLVDMRNASEEQLRRELGAAQTCLRERRQALTQARARYDEFTQKRPTGRELQGAQLTQAHAYGERLREVMVEAEAGIARAAAAVEEARVALTRAGQDRLAAERLADREHQMQDTRQSVAEQSEQDEQGTRRSLEER